MNYDLAKKLKDAGFPQKSSVLVFQNRESADLYISEHGNVSKLVTDKWENMPYLPTLSELIEECGHTYNAVCLLAEFELLWSKDKWFAAFTDSDHKIIDNMCGEGLVPEEAVLNLWLELNKK